MFRGCLTDDLPHRQQRGGSSVECNQVRLDGRWHLGQLRCQVAALALGTGATFTSLQAAVDAARSRQTLVVRGICQGSTVIDKKLVIEGDTTASGVATLSGGSTSVVRIVRGLRVKLRSLVIRDGHARRDPLRLGGSGGQGGGGINNRGRLTLVDVVVRDNNARWSGGGIWSAGSVTLTGHSRVIGNRTRGDAGGVFMQSGRLTLDGASEISGNYGPFEGAGIFNGNAILTLKGESRVTGNTTRKEGGGIYNSDQGTVILNGRSSVSGNFAGQDGGGIANFGILTLNDHSSVSGNTGADAGGGIANWGLLTLNDDSHVSGNTVQDVADYRGTASHVGGGIMNVQGGTLLMNDRSRVTGNTVHRRTRSGPRVMPFPDGVGGGLMNFATVYLADSSSIDGNVADGGGGGVAFTQDGDETNGFVCGPSEGANVRGNSPDDCLALP